MLSCGLVKGKSLELWAISPAQGREFLKNQFCPCKLRWLLPESQKPSEPLCQGVQKLTSWGGENPRRAASASARRKALVPR